MLGMGTSAVATEARNCCVGALSCDVVRLRRRNLGRGGDGGCVWPSVNGSGVLGVVDCRRRLGRAALKGSKGDMVYGGWRGM